MPSCCPGSSWSSRRKWRRPAFRRRRPRSQRRRRAPSRGVDLRARCGLVAPRLARRGRGYRTCDPRCLGARLSGRLANLRHRHRRAPADRAERRQHGRAQHRQHDARADQQRAPRHRVDARRGSFPRRARYQPAILRHGGSDSRARRGHGVLGAHSRRQQRGCAGDRRSSRRRKSQIGHGRRTGADLVRRGRGGGRSRGRQPRSPEHSDTCPPEEMARKLAWTDPAWPAPVFRG